MLAIQADWQDDHGRGRFGPILPAQVLEAFGPEFLDGAACREWILAQAHPAGPACPWCGKAVSSPRTQATWRNLGRVQCTACGRFFTALTGTALNKTGLDCRGYLLLCLLLALGAGDQAIARKLSINHETVRRGRLRLAALEQAQATAAYYSAQKA